VENHEILTGLLDQISLTTLTLAKEEWKDPFADLELCEQCGFKFENKEFLDKHMAEVHDPNSCRYNFFDGKYMCSICEIRGEIRIDIMLHLKLKHGIEPYKAKDLISKPKPIELY
jgi:hypothetical protein